MANRTVTIKPDGGGDYTSLNTALSTELGLYPNLTVDNGSGGAGILTFECYASSSPLGAATTGTGWTTSADYYLNIIGAPSELTPGTNTGKWSTTRARIAGGGDYTYLLRLRAPYTHVKDLQFDYTGTISEGAPYAIYVSVAEANPGCVIESCLVRRVSGTGTVRGIYGAYGATVRNCIVYGTFQYGILVTGSGTEVITAYNNTVHGCTTGIAAEVTGAGSTLNLKNNLCNGNTTDYAIEAYGTVNTATNLSEDTTSPNNALDSKVVAFVDETNKDFHLAPEDTSAKDTGTDLYGAGVTTDIDGALTGTTRNDIGAHEYEAAASFKSAWARGSNVVL